MITTFVLLMAAGGMVSYLGAVVGRKDGLEVPAVALIFMGRYLTGRGLVLWWIGIAIQVGAMIGMCVYVAAGS